MSLFAADFPDVWNCEEIVHGNRVLLAFVDTSVHLIAPPGVRIQADEIDGARRCWRYAMWEESLDLGPPAISIDEPSLVADLETAEVVTILPSSLHDFVRSEMARQLCRAETFGKPMEGARLTDRQALLAGRTRSWAAAELAHAFPGEHWFEIEEPEMRIPGTVDELLACMPPAEETRQGDRRSLHLLSIRGKVERLQVKIECEAFLGLAVALRLLGRRWGRSEELALRCNRRVLDEQCGLLSGRSELTR